MKNKNKIFLILGILLILVFIYEASVTYAKYVMAGKDPLNADFAKWHIKVNNQDIDNKKIVSIDDEKVKIIADKNDESSKYFSENIFAPGRYGYFELSIDYSDVTVPFTYEVSASNTSGNNNIIEYIRVKGQDEDETLINEDVNKNRNSPIDVDNPLKKQILTENSNLVALSDSTTTPESCKDTDGNVISKCVIIRVYFIWKKANTSSNTSSFTDNLSTGGTIKYNISLSFNQITSSSEIITPEPEVDPFLIGDRTSIITNGANAGNNTEKIDFGDKINLDGENFYVMDIDEEYNTVSLLSEYNLNIGGTSSPEGAKLGVQNSECLGSNGKCTLPFYTPSDSSLCLINNFNGEEISAESAEQLEQYGLVDSLNPIINSCKSYWNDSSAPYPSDVFRAYNKDENVNSFSDLAKHIDSYEQILKKNFASAKVTILTHDQVLNFREMHKDDTTSKWFYNTSFWTGTASNRYNVLYVNSDGSYNYGQGLFGKFTGGEHFYKNDKIGVRPYVTLYAKDIKPIVINESNENSESNGS